MYTFFLVIHVIVCVLLITIVLLQAGKGGGLSGAFGVNDSQMIFGNRAGDFLSKATTTFAIIFMAGALALTFMSARRSASVMEGLDIPGAQKAASEEDDLDRLKITLDEDITEAVRTTSQETNETEKKPVEGGAAPTVEISSEIKPNDE